MFGIVFRIEAKPGKYQELVDFLIVVGIRIRLEPFQRWSSGLRDELGTNFTVLFRGEAVWSPVG